MQELIRVSEAEQLIRESLFTLPAESCALDHTSGRFLREDIQADRLLPPYHRVMMDGIAISYSAFQKGTRVFEITATQAAGTPAKTLSRSDTCIEVMTGCELANGCDCVIPIEQIEIHNHKATLLDTSKPIQNQHIHPAGSDCSENQILLEKGTQLHAPELTIAASCGKTVLTVSTLPKIHLISTGDELIPPDETPLPHQIRRSHATALRSCIEGKNLGQLTEEHLPDDAQSIRTRITSALQENDILILTGGISMGKFDHVAPVLHELLGDPHFHGIAQRPGKPMAFWTARDDSSIRLIFALPGNPVSVMACAARYLFPALTHLQSGTWPEPEQLPTSGQFQCPPHFTGLIPCLVKNGQAQLLPASNSGNFLALAGTHGVAEISGEFAGKSLLNQPTNFYPWI